MRHAFNDIDPSADLGRGETETIGSTLFFPILSSNEELLPGSHSRGLQEDDALENGRDSEPFSAEAGPSDAGEGRLEDPVEIASDASGSRVTIKAGPFSSETEKLLVVKRGLQDAPECLEAASDAASIGWATPLTDDPLPLRERFPSEAGASNHGGIHEDADDSHEAGARSTSAVNSPNRWPAVVSPPVVCATPPVFGVTPPAFGVTPPVFGVTPPVFGISSPEQAPSKFDCEAPLLRELLYADSGAPTASPEDST